MQTILHFLMGNSLLWSALYFVALGTAGFRVYHHGNEEMAPALALIAVNAAVMQMIVVVVTDRLAVKEIAIVDFLIGTLMLAGTSNKARIFIGEMFFVQIGISFAFWWLGATVEARGLYHFALNFVGWGQVAALYWGASNDTGKRLAVDHHIHRHARGAPRHALVRQGEEE